VTLVPETDLLKVVDRAYVLGLECTQRLHDLSLTRPEPIVLGIGWGYLPALFMKNTRLFLAGDLVFAAIFNGGGSRCAISGYSSKLRCALPAHNESRLVVQYARYSPSLPWRPCATSHDFRSRDKLPFIRHTGKSPLRLFEPPRELVGRPLADATVRACALETLRAAYVACRVGTSSPATEEAS